MSALKFIFREARIFLLLVIGYVLLERSDWIAQFLNQAELAPVVFKAGLIAFAMAFARILLRIFFPWADIGVLVKKAHETPLASAIIGASLVLLVIEMFKLLAVV